MGGYLKATQASVPTNGLVVSHLGMGDGGRHEEGRRFRSGGGGFGDGGFGRLCRIRLQLGLANSEFVEACMQSESCKVLGPGFRGFVLVQPWLSALRRAGSGGGAEERLCARSMVATA